MRVLLLFVLMGLAALQAPAGTITGLCNTGFTNTTCLSQQADGALDGNYALITNPNGVGGPFVVNQVGFPLGTGPWMADTSTSKWIGPAADQSANCCALGTYDYKLSFSVAGGPVSITGRWASDNSATMLLNGSSTSNTTPSTTASFTAWTPFTLNAVPSGANTVDFLVTNTGGPSGLRVEFSNVPEPSTLTSLGIGLLAVTLGFRKRRS